MRHLLARLFSTFRPSAGDADFTRELESHIEMATADNIAQGMSPAEARRAARVRIGAASSLVMQHRDTRTLPAFGNLLQDLRFAGRLIVRDTWFSAAAVIALALGIGANTLGFTIINAAFIRGFAFEAAEEIHAVSWRPTRGRRLASGVLDFEDWQTQTRSFASLAASSRHAINISDDHAAPEQTQGASITANFFEVLRQRTLLGRAFVAGEDRPGADPVVIIGYDLWRNRFDRDPSVIGTLLRIDGKAATIVGVMPEGMKFPDNSELWLPLNQAALPRERNARTMSVFGRLNPGITREQAEAEIDGIAKRVIAANPDIANSVIGGQVETLQSRFLNGSAPRMFMVIMGAVIFVLLIACANVATLLLSRAMYRGREVAVRYSLGATRWRVVRQLLIESISLAMAGGLLGLALATAGVRVFDSAIHATGAPYWLRFVIDYRVVAYVAGICVATGVLFGLAPALQVSRENPHETLKESGRGNAGNRRTGRLGSTLVIAELALTVVLLFGGGLMLRSFVALYSAPPGFDLNGLTWMKMQLPPSNYPTAEARGRFFEQLLPKVQAIAGVRGATLTTAVPPLDQEEWRFEIDGRRYEDDRPRPFTSTVLVAPNYFDVLGVRITRGRMLNEQDGADGADNIVISQVMAERFFRGEDPIGRQIRFMPRDDEPAPRSWRTIVGIAAPFAQGSTDDAFRSPVVYIPYREAPSRTTTLLVRSGLPPSSVMSAVRAAVQSLDADQPVFAIDTLANAFANERSIYRIFATLFTVLALIGIVLSAVGVYGVMAYAVAQRTQEIGVRMAIGAGRWDVAWLFLKRGVTQIAIAMAIGLPAALGLGMLLRLQLVAIEPSDPVTFVSIVVVLGTVALSACLAPVRKAAQVDPVVALRAD